MKNTPILVTGGAGYIGSHTVRALVSHGYQVTVLDNFVSGHRGAIIDPSVQIITGDLSDEALLEKIFSETPFAAVIHFAAFIDVGESVKNPLKYFTNNTAKPLALLRCMEKYNCRAFVFSSTAAVYGSPQITPIDESHPLAPINPYGQSKLMLENILSDCETSFGLKSVKLRYFNACGASEDARIGEDHRPESHLIPRILMAARGEIDYISIYGEDYPTPDGTCIRDYIHVLDLASAHLKALEYLQSGGNSTACNLGTGSGVSVNEIIQKAEKITHKAIPLIYGKRREGDPPELVASAKKADQVLGWKAHYTDVSHAIQSAWNWMNGSLSGHYN